MIFFKRPFFQSATVDFINTFLQCFFIWFDVLFIIECFIRLISFIWFFFFVSYFLIFVLNDYFRFICIINLRYFICPFSMLFFKRDFFNITFIFFLCYFNGFFRCCLNIFKCNWRFIWICFFISWSFFIFLFSLILFLFSSLLSLPWAHPPSIMPDASKILKVLNFIISLLNLKKERPWFNHKPKSFL